MIRALFGGSFDPIHFGHAAMVEHVLRTGVAEVVHVVPAWRSPFKNAVAASPADRLQMVQLSFGAMPDVIVDSREIDQRHPCFTIDTLASLRAEHPADEWRLLIGADNLPGFAAWHQAEKLQQMATIVVMGRADVDLSTAAIEAAGLAASRCLVVPDFRAPVSSTSVRAMLATGTRNAAELVAGGLLPAVVAYVVAHQLYFPEVNGEDLVPDPD